MKNRLILQKAFLALWLILGYSTMSIGQADKLTVGKLVNNVPTLTDVAAAQNILLQDLTKGSTVTNIRILGPDDTGKYYLAGDVVVNDNVTGRGFQMNLEGNDITIVRGPGVEITCHGDNCNRCVLSFKNWKPYCTCENVGPTEKPEESKCDMSFKMFVTTW